MALLIMGRIKRGHYCALALTASTPEYRRILHRRLPSAHFVTFN